MWISTPIPPGRSRDQAKGALVPKPPQRVGIKGPPDAQGPAVYALPLAPTRTRVDESLGSQ